MGSEQIKPRQPFSEFFELHDRITHQVMSGNALTEEEYTQFLISEINKFFTTNHQTFKQGMCKYVEKNSAKIYKCYKQFVRENCDTQNWSKTCINPSSLEEEFYQYIVEFYQCSVKFSISKKDYLSIIDDVQSFMNFLTLIKKSVVKPKLWSKTSKQYIIQPISHSVHDLLFSIGKNVYDVQIERFQKWINQNPQKYSITEKQLQNTKTILKYIHLFQKKQVNFMKKQQCLIKLILNSNTQDEQRHHQILLFLLKKFSNKFSFVELLILSRLGSHQATKLVGVLEKQLSLDLSIN